MDFEKRIPNPAVNRPDWARSLVEDGETENEGGSER
jgi:hypothetical protein